MKRLVSLHKRIRTCILASSHIETEQINTEAAATEDRGFTRCAEVITAQSSASLKHG